jgi:hypothetical protein
MFALQALHQESARTHHATAQRTASIVRRAQELSARLTLRDEHWAALAATYAQLACLDQQRVKVAPTLNPNPNLGLSPNPNPDPDPDPNPAVALPLGLTAVGAGVGRVSGVGLLHAPGLPCAAF